MTISLFRFPFLVQRQIFEEIDLLAVLYITMLSKKSNAIARACLSHHKYHLHYVEDDYFQLERKFLNENGNTLVLRLQCLLKLPYQLWSIGNQKVPIESTSIESDGKISTIVHVSSDDSSDFSIETLQYLTRLLPKLSLTLALSVSDAEEFRRTMKSVESLVELEEILAVGPSWNTDKGPHDESLKLVLDECQRAKKLRISITTSENFVYPTNLPFNFDSISIVNAGWVSRDYFIKLFLSCKKVELHGKNFSDADFTAIFKAWTEGSRLEYLQLNGLWNFDQGETLGSVFEEFPGAAPVRKAIVPVASITDSRVVKFEEGKCYRIQQRDGQTTALVYVLYQTVTLSTKFQIGEEVDEMAAELEEDGVGREIEEHPLDENMEAEEEDWDM